MSYLCSRKLEYHEQEHYHIEHERAGEDAAREGRLCAVRWELFNLYSSRQDGTHVHNEFGTLHGGIGTTTWERSLDIYPYREVTHCESYTHLQGKCGTATTGDVGHRY